MYDSLTRSPATDATGYLPGPLGLRLDEEFIALSTVHIPASELDTLVPLGERVNNGESTWLRLWPDVLWVTGTPPQGLQTSVDISNGKVHLRLRGVEALHLLANYSTTDLNAAPIRSARTLRTRIGQYPVVLWWDSTRDVHMVVGRSLAQSFCDHLRALAVRHDPTTQIQNVHSVAPTAPNRRG